MRFSLRTRYQIVDTNNLLKSKGYNTVKARMVPQGEAQDAILLAAVFSG